jgi:hypothetical protein
LFCDIRWMQSTHQSLASTRGGRDTVG